MGKRTEFIKAMQRPYVVITGWSVVLVMALAGKPLPDFITGFLIALTAFVFGERAKHSNGPPGATP